MYITYTTNTYLELFVSLRMSKIETRKLSCVKTTCLCQPTIPDATKNSKRTLEAPQVFSIDTFFDI